MKHSKISICAWILLFLFLPNVSLFAISAKDSDAQKSLKGRYSKPSKFEWPKFKWPSFDLKEFDEMSEEQDKAWGRASEKSEEASSEDTMTDSLAKLVENPKIAKLLDKAKENSSSAADPSQDQAAMMEKYQALIRQAQQLSQEAARKQALTEQHMEEIERG